MSKAITRKPAKTDGAMGRGFNPADAERIDVQSATAETAAVDYATRHPQTQSLIIDVILSGDVKVPTDAYTDVWVGALSILAGDAIGDGTVTRELAVSAVRGSLKTYSAMRAMTARAAAYKVAPNSELVGFVSDDQSASARYADPATGRDYNYGDKDRAIVAIATAHFLADSDATRTRGQAARVAYRQAHAEWDAELAYLTELVSEVERRHDLYARIVARAKMHGVDTSDAPKRLRRFLPRATYIPDAADKRAPRPIKRDGVWDAGYYMWRDRLAGMPRASVARIAQSELDVAKRHLAFSGTGRYGRRSAMPDGFDYATAAAPLSTVTREKPRLPQVDTDTVTVRMATDAEWATMRPARPTA